MATYRLTPFPATSPPGVADACDPGAILAPEHRVRRLTHAEYRYTLHDLFGIDPSRVELTSDAGEARFENDIAELVPSEALVHDYAATAAAVASDAAAAWAQALSPCGEDAACVSQAMAALTLPIARRPLESTVRERYVGFYLGERGAGSEATEAAALVLEALLQSAHFLYRIDSIPSEVGTFEVDEWSLASRLSYFLWQTMPDARLFERAAAGELSVESILEQEARRMVADPKAARTMGAFHQQWLQAQRLFHPGRALHKDPDSYPQWSAELRQSMVEEMGRFAERVYAERGTVADLLTSRTTVVDAHLAALYGVPAPIEGWEPRELPADQRAGLLTLAGFLAGHAGTRDPSPVHTGLFVKHDLLCGAPTPDPQELGIEPELAELNPSQTNRERWQADTGRSPCVSCHEEINALGFAFEEFDAIGAYRLEDRGQPVDASGRVTGSDVDGSFEGAVELAEQLAGSERVQRCIANRWYGFAHGQPPTPDDGPAIACIADRLTASGGRLDELLVAIVTDRSFRTTRRSLGEE